MCIPEIFIPQLSHMCCQMFDYAIGFLEEKSTQNDDPEVRYQLYKFHDFGWHYIFETCNK